MKQYCRYCSHCCYGDVVYCDFRKRTMSEESAKRVNQCKDFEFNPIDAFNIDKTYKPREKKETKVEQINLLEVDL